MLIAYALKSEVLFQVTQAAYHSWTLCSAILYSYYAILFKFYLQPLLFFYILMHLCAACLQLVLKNRNNTLQIQFGKAKATTKAELK